jgi:AcrR family transcriptional regulator
VTGLGRGALYHHIDSKEDLLYYISTRYIQELIAESRNIAAAEMDPIKRIRKLSRCMMDVVYTHSAEMTVCFREIHALSGERYREVLQLHMDYQQIWVDTLAMGVAQGDLRDIPKVTVKGIMGMFFYSFMWLKPIGNQNADDVADAFSDIIIRGLREDPK